MSNTSPPDNPSPHHPVSLAASDLARITHDHNSDISPEEPQKKEKKSKSKSKRRKKKDYERKGDDNDRQDNCK